MFIDNFKIVTTILFIALSMAVSAQEICDNGIDDDGDSLVDLNDSDCDCANVVPLTTITGNACRRLDLTMDVPGATSYQWYKDGVALTGYTNNTIGVTRWNPFGDGCYQLLVQTPSGCVLSEEHCAEVVEHSADLGIQYICQGDTLVLDELLFEGEVIPIDPPQTFTTSGATSFKTSRPSDGCDIRISLKVEILQSNTFNENDVMCTGGTYINGNIMATEPGIYYDTLQNVGGCDSIIRVNLTFEDLDPIEVDAAICEGDTYEFLCISATTEGTYDCKVETPGACDTFYVVNLSIIEPDKEERDEVICSGGLFELGTISTSEAGTHTTSLQSSTGCDSIDLTINLTVAPPDEYNFQETICQGQTFVYGDINTTEAGMHQYLSTEGACDSLIIIELAVTAPEEMLTEETICQGMSFEWRGNTYDTEDVYTELESAAGECDVIHILDLKVVSPDPVEEDHEICDGETFKLGDFETKVPGTDTVVVAVDGQCDQVYIIHLEVNQPSSSTLVEELCGDDVFTLFDLTTDQIGSHIATTTNVAGCDSTIMVELVGAILEPSIEERSICPGDFTTWNGEDYNTAGDHNLTLQNVNGCDSLATLRLAINTAIDVRKELHDFCSGDVFTYNGEDYEETGTYTTTVVTGTGCDSLVTLDLFFGAHTSGEDSIRICDGDIYTLPDGREVSTEGSYKVMLQNAVGCDSTLTLLLKVLTDEPFSMSEEICEGEIYILPDGEEATDAGRYEAVVQSSLECDSTIVIDLQVNPLNQRAQELLICPGDVVDFYGEEISLAGSYTRRLSNESGCDSIISLTIDFDASLGDVELPDTLLVNLGSTVDIEPTYVDPSFVSVKWLDTDGEIMSIENLLSNFSPADDTYVDFVATNANGCEITKRLRIDVELIIDIYVPNVITPDSDSYDSFFNIRANESVVAMSEIQIYDRWGELMHVGSHDGSLDTYIGWDGRYKGKKVEPAVFAYYAVFEIIDGSFVKRAGDLTVIR